MEGEVVVALEMRDGRVWVEMEEYRWSAAAPPLADAQWHALALRLDEDKAHLSVDGVPRSWLWTPPPRLADSPIRVPAFHIPPF